MTTILLLALGLALLALPTFRCAFFHPVGLIWYGVRDLYWWICRHGYNVCPTGELVAYTGLFGKGKTLSVVHKVTGAYQLLNPFAE